MAYNDRCEVGELLGKTLTEVKQLGSDELRFTTTEGEVFNMFHDQDCCEDVNIDDIVGDLENLVGSPILQAEESSNVPTEAKNDGGYTDESFTWTFYNFATAKGYVTVKWYGSSNGYYSEGVNFEKVPALN